VTGNSDCERFQDDLDRVFEGTGTETAMDRLREHARSCPDCAMLLEMQRHLTSPSQAGLEATVPDHLVEGMWPRVELDIMRDEWRRSGERRRAPAWRWVVGVQAAAIALLIVGSAYQFSALKTIRSDEAALTEKLARQDQQLASLAWNAQRTEERLGTRTAGSTLQRRLGADGEMTVAEVTRFLEQLPEDSRVLGAKETKRLVAQLSYTRSGAPSTGLEDFRADDGLQAGEALKLIASLELDPSQRFPSARLARLSRQYD